MHARLFTQSFCDGCTEKSSRRRGTTGQHENNRDEERADFNFHDFTLPQFPIIGSLRLQNFQPLEIRVGDESEFFCEAANGVEIFYTGNVVEIVVVRAGNEDDCVITRKALANPL